MRGILPMIYASNGSAVGFLLTFVVGASPWWAFPIIGAVWGLILAFSLEGRR